MRIIPLLLLVTCVFLVGCGEPVRIGVHEAHASGMPAIRNGHPRPGAAGVIRTAAGQTASPSAGLLFIPQVPQPHGPLDIVGLKLERDGSGSTRPITFGQIFAPGQLLPGSGLGARIGTSEIPAQLDVKTTNPDGSVRFGIVTIVADAPAAVMLFHHAATTAVPVDLAALAGKYNLAVDLVMHETSVDVPHHFVAGTLLAEALRNGTASFWLRGPLATEARVIVPVQNAFRLVFDIRGYADGSTFTDVQFNNDIALQPIGGAVSYDVTISVNGKPVFQQAAIKQYQYQTWHREIWSNGAPDVNVVHDVAAMERANAIQNYDLTAGVSAGLIGYSEKAMRRPDFFAVLGNAAVTKYMGMTGGRGDIGPLTLWNTAWLMTQNPVLRRMAMAQSDAGGSVPWHFFDPTTGTYVTLTHHPNLWSDPRGRGSRTTGLPIGQDVDTKGSGWAPDGAHQPELNYVPYMLTGSRYRLDQLDAQATASILSVWPIPREDGKGIIVHPITQVRGQAWNLREVVEAAFIDPDDDKLKPYFAGILANNIAYLLHEAQNADEGEAYGWIKGVYGDNNGAIAPWQQDYLATTIVLAARQGVPGAKQVLAWQSHFLAGRFLAAAQGFPPYDAVTYNLYTGTRTAPYQTWREIEEVTAAHKMSGGGTTWPMTFVPYIEAADAVLSGVITVTGSPDARKALEWLEDKGAEKAPRSRLLADPTWNIVASPPK